MAGCTPRELPIELAEVLPERAELRLVEDASGRPVAIDAAGLGDELLDRLRREPLGFEDWSAVFTVAAAETAAAEGAQPEATPIAGDYRVTADAVRFLPAEPFERGASYSVRWLDSTETELTFEPSRDGAPATTQVVAIYPSADNLPQNLARFHIQFTAPMREGTAGEHVRLVVEGSGERVDAFADEAREVDDEPRADEPSDAREQAISAEGATEQDVEQDVVERDVVERGILEEWSEDGTRLTLNLAVDEDGRTPLEIAGRYRLLVDRGWEDARGVPLRGSFEKVFAVVKPDRDPPDVQSWSVTPPVSAAAPLVVDFPAPLDHVRLHQALEVVSQDHRIEGSVLVSNEEKRWSFSSAEPWQNGRYVVRVVEPLDDPAGNPLGGAQGSNTTGVGTVVPFLVEIPEAAAPRRRRAG
ncbi:MAG TPA: hypothetical protein VMT85_01850 [Thermoanaerobaculia bacterium]|nr:hypothetical protein [Thermoanaerobaculia bacterium]